jgi:hypothetical protein
MRERISQTGRALVLCPFHNEKNPSLRIWPDGGFHCHGCGETGHLDQHPKLLTRYLTLRASHPAFSRPEQCCFPWRGIPVVDKDPKLNGARRRYADIVLVGCLLPWRGVPAFLTFQGGTGDYVPLFTTQSKLEETMGHAKIPYTQVVRVNDEFLEIVQPKHPIAVNPQYELGGARWIELARP